MSSETWNVILIILVVLVAVYAGYQQYRRGEAFTVEGVAHTLEASIPFASELIEVSQIAVNEAELMKKNKQITNEEAFNHALNVIKGWSPQLAGIENSKIISAINSAVLVASALSHQIGADKNSNMGATGGTTEDKRYSRP